MRYLDPRALIERENCKNHKKCWEGRRSASKLREVTVQNKSEEILRNIPDNISLSDDERTRLRSMFRESLTLINPNNRI